MVKIADLESGHYWGHMNMETVADADGKTVVVMELTEDLKQIYGNIHGGAIAGLMDSTIAVAINQQLDPGEGASTVEIKINYLRPANTGKLWGKGKVIQKGRKIMVGQGEIKDDNGKLVAFGTATFMINKFSQ